MVEFALILIPLLLLVAGIIQFGIGLNFWLDMNRVANQGARHAVVNHGPGCASNAGGNSCTNTTWNCLGAPPTNLRLDRWLYCQTVSQGLRNSVAIEICYPDDSDLNTSDGRTGSPVKVQLTSPFTFVPLLGIGTIDLKAQATMRLEQDTLAPGATMGHLSGVGACPP